MYFFAFFHSVTEFRSRAEQNVTRGVDSGFERVLNYAYYKADADHLHRYIGIDAKKRTSHRNEEQRASRNTRSSASYINGSGFCET